MGTLTITGQTSIFDLLEVKAPTEDQLAVVDGPGTFWKPGNLQAMWEAREAHFNKFRGTHGEEWQPYRGWDADETCSKDSDHYAQVFDANLGCRHFGTAGCYCVGGFIYRAYCHGCQWWGPIRASANAAWEAQLDHCWPGWRDLPVIEASTSGYSYTYHVPKDYPAEWQVPGAPTKDCRGLTNISTRHVPAGNQYGGLKLGISQECDKHKGSWVKLPKDTP